MTTVKQAGKKGGSVKSDAKTKAARANAKKPRGKWVTAIYAAWKSTDEKEHSALIVSKGKFKEHDPQALLDEIEKSDMAKAFPVVDLLELEASSTRLVL